MEGANLSGVDMGALKEGYDEVMRVLTSTCGLTDYQVRCYLSLVAQGEASANSVAIIAQIPRTSAYKSLRGLCGRGWAKSAGGRPELFAATKPVEISKALTMPVEEALRKVSLVEGVLSARGAPQVVYTILGRERVLKRMGEIADSATKTLIIATPKFSALRRTLSRPLRGALRRGVAVTVITEPYQRVPDGVEVKRRTDLMVTDLISDGSKALLAAPDLEACGYTDNPQLTRHLEDFLKIIVEKS